MMTSASALPSRSCPSVMMMGQGRAPTFFCTNLVTMRLADGQAPAREWSPATALRCGLPGNVVALRRA